MRLKKCMIACLLATTLISSSVGMSACKKDVATEDIELTSTTIVGKVTAVENDRITMTVGSMMSMGAGSMGQGMDMNGTPGSSNESVSDNSQNTPPDKPDGESAGATDNADGGSAPSGNASTFITSDTTMTVTVSDTSVLSNITMDDIKEGAIISVETDSEGDISLIEILDVSDNSMPGGSGMGEHGSAASDIEYSAVKEYTSDTNINGDSISSTGKDENAILVKDGKVTLDKVTVDRTSSESTGGDNSSFYGVGAAVLASAGTTYVKDSTITTDSAGGAGLFAYADGTMYAADSTITTTQDASGGIHVAGGGKLYAWDLAVETNGKSSAAIRSDRGGGTMVIDGGTYTSNGIGSPAVYCTADITANNAKLTATGSEAVCIEGLNSLRLFDCDLSGNMSDDSQNDCTWDIIVYQSMSGDSEVGNSTFDMVGGTLTSKNGGLLYTTNTECDILLSGVDINYSDDNDFFLQVTGNSNERGWGTAGANGSQCTFTADNQEMKGKIIYDSISTLDFYMKNGSSLIGSFTDDESYAGNGGDGYCNVYIGSDSKWTVTGDSTIDDLYNAGTITDADGKTVTIRGTDGKVYVEGTSSYTITVDSYSTEDKSSEALETPVYADYEVERSEEMK